MQSTIRRALLRSGPAAAACLLGVAMASSPGLAQTLPKIDCDKAMNTHELNWCSEQALDTADRKLNDAYKKLLAHIAKSDEVTKSNREKWVAALRLAQRHWVAFRDQDCGEVIGYEWSGGTGATGAMLGCKITKTEIRTKELEERLPQ